MIRNKISYYIQALLLTLVFSFSSCGEDFLDLQPKEALPTDKAIQSVDGLNAAILGVYDQFQNSDYYGRYFILVPDVMSDDVKQNASANRAKEYAEYGAYSEHFITNDIWKEIYKAINRANTIINSTVEVGATVQAEKDHIVGQAFALRALAHFDLVRLYAQHYGFTSDNNHPGISIVTEFDQNAEPSRNTVQQVYDQVLADFAEADRLLDENQFNSGRIGSLAVKALMARVVLYQGDWAKAEQLATEVINNSELSLTPTDSYVATWAEGSAPDVIFEIVMTDTDNNGSDALGRMYIVDGYGDYLPSADAVDLIPDGDVRKALYKDDSSNLGGIYGNIRVDKYPSPQGTDNTPVIRLAEIYLIRAEARAQQGKDMLAQDDLNAIRQRALPSADAVTAIGQALLDEIELEKRIELLFEGHRLWELMRKKKGVVRNDCTAPADACIIPYPNDRFILPMPEEELLANPNMTQNPGY